jgi:hypothetical protein
VCFRIAISAKGAKEAVHHARQIDVVCYRGFVARLGAGMGQLSLPRVQPRALGARDADVFVATSGKAAVFSAGLRRGETPPPSPDLFPRPPVTLGRRQPTVLPACRASLTAPRCAINCSTAQRGDPASPYAAADASAPTTGEHALGRRRGFAPPQSGPVASTVLPQLCVDAQHDSYTRPGV